MIALNKRRNFWCHLAKLATSHASNCTKTICFTGKLLHYFTDFMAGCILAVGKNQTTVNQAYEKISWYLLYGGQHDVATGLPWACFTPQTPWDKHNSRIQRQEHIFPLPNTNNNVNTEIKFQWNNQQMQLYAVNFIPLLGSLYMFRVFYTPETCRVNLAVE